MSDSMIEPEIVQDFYDQACLVMDELASLREGFDEQCVDPRGRLNDIKNAAKAAGIPKKTFSAMLRKRTLDQQLAALPETMDEDEAAMFAFAVNIVISNEPFSRAVPGNQPLASGIITTTGVRGTTRVLRQAGVDTETWGVHG